MSRRDAEDAEKRRGGTMASRSARSLAFQAISHSTEDKATIAMLIKVLFVSEGLVAG